MGSSSDGQRRPALGHLGGLRAAARSAPVPARIASLLLALEALTLLALGVLQVLRGFGSGIDDVTRAEMGGLLALLGGAGVAALAIGVLRRSGSFRSPTLVVQLLCLPVGWGLIQAGEHTYGVALIVVPLVIVVALLAAAGLGPSEQDDPSDIPPRPGQRRP
ncbi:hypothetical protein MXD61_19835 [Frankia sp. AgPm24]|uniref:hypothetical protein n=1 Tax=Frankia sp. AgPm24 TaxID=631128 RepID=UPI00200E28B7|nr:hypothetical protein [Frankia sp. AgPm24]MCK9924089.1 hypothetical protein [Frankia sp. AgPm24]